MSTFGIAVGGGPAPGINGVIGAAATRALRLGHRVIGIYDGFSRIMEGDTSRVAELSVDGNGIACKDIFTFAVERTAAGGAVEGTFHASGHVPGIVEDLALRGISIDTSIFKRMR